MDNIQFFRAQLDGVVHRPLSIVHMENLIIIGSGPAGYTAAIYAARSGHGPLMFAGEQVGGQLTTTTEVDNFPGFPDGIMGPELMERLRKQAEKFGTKIVEKNVTAVDLKSDPKKVTVDNETYEAKCVIIATGASARRLGLENEKKLYGKGVSACATCDGFFFKNKKVVVVGGGDAAMEEATFLTKYASSVVMINRSDVFRASEIMQEKAKANPKISFIMNSTVEDVLGVEAGKVTGVKLKNSQTGEVTEVATDGVFVAIGHVPNTKIFEGQLTLDKVGYIVPKNIVTTDLAGVFVAGDVADARYRQAASAAGTGCMAAIEAEKFLTEK
jgi:thioredoxin reductase (NADPH)